MLWRHLCARWGWVVNATTRQLYPGEWPGTHWIRGWVRPRAGLDGCGKFASTGFWSPDRPARSESLLTTLFRPTLHKSAQDKQKISWYWCYILYTAVRPNTQVSLPSSPWPTLRTTVALWGTSSEEKTFSLLGQLVSLAWHWLRSCFECVLMLELYMCWSGLREALKFQQD